MKKPQISTANTSNKSWLGLAIFSACGLLFSADMAHAQENAGITRVFIAAGQSNMWGRGSEWGDLVIAKDGEDLKKRQDLVWVLPYGKKDGARPFLKGKLPTSPLDARIPFSWSLYTSTFSASLQKNGSLAPIQKRWGPEMSFCRRILEAQPSPLVLIKVCQGNTSLWKDWNPKAESDPELMNHPKRKSLLMYKRLIEHVKLTLSELDAQKVNYQVEAMLWLQGESDGKHKHEYEENFRNFFAAVRRDLKVPQLTLVVADTGKPEVRAAQAKIAQETGGVCISTADLKKDVKPDFIHFNAPALLDIGHRMADAYLKQRSK